MAEKFDNNVMDILVVQQSQIQTLFFIIDYLVEKLNLDPKDLENYIQQKAEEYRKKLIEQSKIVVPPPNQAMILQDKDRG